MKQCMLEKKNKEVVGVRPSWRIEIESKDKRANLNYQLEERDFWLFVRQREFRFPATEMHY